MFYEFNDEVITVDVDKINPNTITAGYVSLDDIDDIADRFGFSQSTVMQCKEENKYFRSSIEVYDEYSFGTLKITDAENIELNNDCIAFYVKKNMLLIVDVCDTDCSTRNKFLGSLNRFSITTVTLEKLIYAFLESLINGDSIVLEDMEFKINELEAVVLNDEANENFNFQLLKMKNKLLILRNYYEQLIDIGEALEENENELFEINDLRYFRIFTNKAIRLKENVDMLRDSVVHLRDAYQSSLDIKLNQTMKVFTVVTTIFLPLTLITGWYGMNFSTMPEFAWKYGYVAVIALVLIIVIVMIYVFKKKKWL